MCGSGSGCRYAVLGLGVVVPKIRSDRVDVGAGAGVCSCECSDVCSGVDAGACSDVGVGVGMGLWGQVGRPWASSPTQDGVQEGVSAVRWDARGPLHQLKMVFRRTTCELGYQFWLKATAAHGPVVQNSQEYNSPCESGVLVICCLLYTSPSPRD